MPVDSGGGGGGDPGIDWVLQQAAYEAQGENDWQGPDGANSAWGLAQWHWNTVMPVDTGYLIDITNAVNGVG